MNRPGAYPFAVKITGWLAAGGAVIGAVIGVVLHVLVWRFSGPAGWWAFFGSPRRYTDYVPVGSLPRATAELHLRTTGGLHAQWWPLLPVTVGTGLITGALLGLAVLTYRFVQRPTTTE